MTFIPATVALALSAAFVILLVWGFTYFAQFLDGLADPTNASQFNSEDVHLAIDELHARHGVV